MTGLRRSKCIKFRASEREAKTLIWLSCRMGLSLSETMRVLIHEAATERGLSDVLGNGPIHLGGTSKKEVYMTGLRNRKIVGRDEHHISPWDVIVYLAVAGFFGWMIWTLILAGG